MHTRRLIAAGLVLGTLAMTVPAVAATVNINSTITNLGTPAAEAYATTPGSTAGAIVETAPTQESVNFGNTFNQAGFLSTAANFGAAATGTGGAWNFQDNILFTVAGATVQATASALTSSVTDLQVRVVALPSAADAASANAFVNLSANAATLLGSTSTGLVVQPGDSWQSLTIGSTDITATLPATLAAGTYVLQVRGEAASAGASYSGSAVFTPVPLPAAAWLLLSGIGGLGAWARKRKLP